MPDRNNFKVDFIGIGAPRCGTTWLTDCLSKHPDICMSEPKEIHYFNKENTFNKNHKKSFLWYTKHFLHCKKKQIKGEFSTNYLNDKKAPEIIKKYFPDVKLIISLRNPIDRTYSDYWMHKNVFKREKKSFEEAIQQEKGFTERGFYFKQISYYLKYFSKEQIHIILFDDIKNKPEEVLRNVLNFLDVNISIASDLLKERSNASKKVRFKFLVDMMDFVSRLLVNLRLSFIVRFAKNIGIKSVIMKLAAVPYKYTEMTPEMRNYLKDVFKSDIQKLEQFIGRDLSHWK